MPLNRRFVTVAVAAAIAFLFAGLSGVESESKVPNQPQGVKLTKGRLLKWGDSQKVLTRIDGYACYGGGDVCSVSNYNYRNPILPEPYLYGQFAFTRHKFWFARLTFHPNYFSKVETSLTTALGPPAYRQTGTVYNAMNAAFDQVEAGWVVGDVRVRLIKRLTDVDQGAVEMTYEPLARTVEPEKPLAPPF